MDSAPKGSKKLINAWATYDLANSSYSIIITATIFPIYYATVTEKNGSDIVNFFGYHFINTVLYTYAIAFAYLLIASLSPLLSGIADYSGMKKRFMQFFCFLGSASCSLLYFFTGENLGLGISLVVLACLGSAGSIVFYNAYLPEIAEPKQQDRVSAKGYAAGYFGNTLLLLICASLFKKPEWYGNISALDASRISFLLVGFWWFGFAQIPFYFLPIQYRTKDRDLTLLFKGYRELIKVFHLLKQSKKLTRFLISFFVYNMGVQTVLLVATLFGKKEIHLGDDQLIMTIFILQFLGIVGAFLFSSISSKIGNILTLKIIVSVWACLCTAAYFIQSPLHFYVLAGFVGLIMGGTQALSRSTYSKFLPDTLDHTSFFSFYDVCEKLGIVLGMSLFGLVETVAENMRTPIISLIVFFLLGFIFLISIPYEAKVNNN